MHLPSLPLSLLFALLPSVLAASDEKELEPCTVISPRNSFYDLRPLAVILPDDEKSKDLHGHGRNESWHARGYDYGANFTINLCAPVVEKLEDVVGLRHSEVRDISAFYTKHGETYSIGQVSKEPIFRGRKLVMNLTDGSPCGEDEDDERLKARKSRRSTTRDERPFRYDDDDEDEEPERGHKGKTSRGGTRRKSTIFSFLCDQDALDPSRPKVSISLVGWSPDECHYDFEVRSHLACGGLAKASDSVGPGGVFSIIVLIAISVYIFGGIAYQRTVMHQRGWRQLPNYAMWAGIASFINDFLVIIFSSCSRLVPRRRGYNQLPNHRGRGISREEENGLIDSLDEEWND